MGGHAAASRGERKGDFLGGKYLLEDCLGVGGMGEVYRATNVSLGRKVAIKILSQEMTQNEDDVLRFLREARAAAAVRHPNVVDVLDVARDDDGTPFIVQELLSGEDLEHYVQAIGGRLTATEALEIMIPVAEAVSAAHARDVVHRDLKPANIFLAREGNRIVPKVLDFGACLFPTLGGLTPRELRMLIGTPHYMAPEQVVSKALVDARADVWAIGVTLYELLVGETPFEAENANAVLALVKTREVPPLRERAKKAPPAMERLVADCTQRDPTKRLADASAVLARMIEVRDVLGGPPEAKLRASGGAASGSAIRAASMPTLAERESEPPPPKRGSPLLTLDIPYEAPSLELAGEQRSSPAAPARRHPRLLTLSSPDEDAPARRPSGTLGAVSAPEPRSPEPSPPPARASGTAPVRPAPAFEAGEADLDLPMEAPASRRAPSSIPPVLDPRAAGPAEETPAAERDSGAERAAVGRSAPEPDSLRVTPPPISVRSVQTPSAAVAPTGAATAKGSPAGLAAIVLGPAVVVFGVLRAMPALTAPLGRAMRGDSTLASGSLAVIALVVAAILSALALSSSRTRSGVAAAGAAVALAITMIIVTFSAGESAALGLPAAGSGVAPWIAPLVPLALGWAPLARAREAWSVAFRRREAVAFGLLTSLLLLLALELGPLGAVRAEPPPQASAPAST